MYFHTYYSFGYLLYKKKTKNICTIGLPERVAAGLDELDNILVSNSFYGGLVHTCDGVPCINKHTQCVSASRHEFTMPQCNVACVPSPAS